MVIKSKTVETQMSTASQVHSIPLIWWIAVSTTSYTLSRILCVYLLELQSSISFFICTWNIPKASFKGPVLPGECEFVSLIDVSVYDFINVKDWECKSLKLTQKRDSSKILPIGLQIRTLLVQHLWILRRPRNMIPWSPAPTSISSSKDDDRLSRKNTHKHRV